MRNSLDGLQHSTFVSSSSKFSVLSGVIDDRDCSIISVFGTCVLQIFAKFAWQGWPGLLVKLNWNNGSFERVKQQSKHLPSTSSSMSKAPFLMVVINLPMTLKCINVSWCTCSTYDHGCGNAHLRGGRRGKRPTKWE